jgi:hypothetical protein
MLRLSLCPPFFSVFSVFNLLTFHTTAAAR